MKSPEQRLKDGLDAFNRAVGGDAAPLGRRFCMRAVMRDVLEAADREPPTWPTDESVDAHRAVEPALDDHIPYEVTRTRLRAAMLADEIFKAAIDVAHSPESGYFTAFLKHAVNEAGL